mgnify:FL=1
MEVLVLGGGYGTRLFGRHNSRTYSPKGLIEIMGRPCIDYALGAFSEDLMDRIILETNKEGKSFYEHWLSKSKFKDKTKVYLEEVSTPEKCLGVLETISIVSNHYKFSKPVLIISPDNLFTKKQDKLITGYTSGIRIATYELNSLIDAQKYGVLELDSEKIIGCIEKPLKPISKTIRTSCEIWSPEVFSLLSEWNNHFDSDKVGDFINFIIKQEIHVKSYKTDGFWIDIGNEQDLQKAREMLK